MKKLFSALLAVIMVMTVAVTAFAAKSYTVEELDVTLEIPDDYFVFTRSMSADDPLFELIELDYTTLMQTMESGDIYLCAISLAGKEIMLIATPVSGMDSYTGYGEETIWALEEEQREMFESKGLELHEYGVYKSGDYTYMKAIAKSESLGMHIAEYVNIIDGKMYGFGFKSAVEITDDEISMMEEIVDSVSYDFLEGETAEKEEDTTYSFDFGGVEEETEAEDEYADDEYNEDEYEEVEDEEFVYADGADDSPSSSSTVSIPGFVFVIIIAILLAIIAAIVLVVIKGKKKQAVPVTVNPPAQGNYPPAQPQAQNYYQPAPEQPQYNAPVAPVQNIQPEEIRPAEPVQQSKLPEEAPTIVAAPAKPAAEEAPKPSFCSNCGTALRADSAFCPMCGTKIG